MGLGLGWTCHLFRDSAVEGLTREKLKSLVGWVNLNRSTDGHGKGPTPMRMERRAICS